MKLRIRTISLIFIAILFIVSVSCQKKEVLQAEEPEPVADQNPEPCPGCEFPDTVWKTSSASPQLFFRLRFDSSLASLNSSGTAFVLPPGHAAQSPTLVALALESIELMQESGTPSGQGVKLYQAPLTNCGSNGSAINFCKLHLIGDSEIVFSIALNSIPPGNYKFLRLGATYAEMKIMGRSTSSGNGPCTVAGFYGTNCYAKKIKTESSVFTPNSETSVRKNYYFEQHVFGQTVSTSGISPQQTVVHYYPANPNSSQLLVEFSGPGSQPKPLQIFGNETTNREIELTFGTNQQFEWEEVTKDGLFQPEIGEMVYDFGFRNLLARH